MEDVPSVDSENGIPARRGGVRARDLAFGLHQPGETGRRDPERLRHPVAEHGGPGVDLGDIAQDRRVKFDVAERLSRPRQRQFLFGGAIGVVERRLGGASFGDAAQILDRQRAYRAGVASSSVAACGTAAVAPAPVVGAGGASSLTALSPRPRPTPAAGFPAVLRWHDRSPATTPAFATPAPRCPRDRAAAQSLRSSAYAAAVTGSRSARSVPESHRTRACGLGSYRPHRPSPPAGPCR